MTEYLDILISLFTGLIASYLLWHLLNKIKVPFIEFKSIICKSPSAGNLCGSEYWVGFRNVGERAIIDLEIIAKLRVWGLFPNRPNRWHAIYIPLEDPRIPKTNTQKKRRRVTWVQLLPNDISTSARQILNLQNRRFLCLEDLFITPESKLQIFVFGYDEYSGTRKLFESEYSIGQIVPCP